LLRSIAVTLGKKKGSTQALILRRYGGTDRRLSPGVDRAKSAGVIKIYRNNPRRELNRNKKDPSKKILLLLSFQKKRRILTKSNRKDPSERRKKKQRMNFILICYKNRLVHETLKIKIFI